MNKKEFFNNYVKPYLTDDKPANRELYSNAIDNAHRDGEITDRQAQNWSYPSTNAFLAPSERRNNKRWKSK